MHKKTVISSMSQENFDDFISPNLASNKWDYEIVKHTPSSGIKGLIDTLNEQKASALLTCWTTLKPLPDNLSDLVPSLKYICHTCGAVGSFIPLTLLQHGITVTNWGNSISRTVAEHCLLQAMAALRRITTCQIEMHIRKGWQAKDYIFHTLFDKKVGIHGFGSIAREFTKLIKPFDCKVSAFTSVPQELLKEHGVLRASSLEELFSQNDIIVELAPLIPKNKGIITGDLLRMIHKDGVFVNSGRGAVVNESHLEEVAQEGNIQIALDVYTNEPLQSDSRLRGCENVLLTPHIGGPTLDERKRCGKHALDNLESYFSGKTLSAVITETEYKRMT